MFLVFIHETLLRFKDGVEVGIVAAAGVIVEDRVCKSKQNNNNECCNNLAAIRCNIVLFLPFTFSSIVLAADIVVGAGGGTPYNYDPMTVSFKNKQTIVQLHCKD